MMNAERNNSKQKHIFFRTYENLSLLEKALKNIKEPGPTNVQISILGKVSQFYHDKNIQNMKDMESIRIYWKNIFDNTIAFDSLKNPEIGNIFIVGALTSTFINKVDGKTLGMLSVGPYGILRGIGANDTQANHYLDLLGSGSYLLIIRGFADELEKFRRILERKEKV